jgi:hypothetical protein
MKLEADCGMEMGGVAPTDMPHTCIGALCPRARLGPSRPSFIGEVRACQIARALPQVRIQNYRHLGSGPTPHEVSI